MKVYLAYYSWYEDWRILGIFSTEQKAWKECFDSFICDSRHLLKGTIYDMGYRVKFHKRFHVKEYELDRER
jgi:hypothetical protein